MSITLSRYVIVWILRDLQWLGVLQKFQLRDVKLFYRLRKRGILFPFLILNQQDPNNQITTEDCSASSQWQDQHSFSQEPWWDSKQLPRWSQKSSLMTESHQKINFQRSMLGNKICSQKSGEILPITMFNSNISMTILLESTSPSLTGTSMKNSWKVRAQVVKK